VVLPINQDSRHRCYQNEHQHQHHGAEDEVVWRQQCVSCWLDGCQGVLEKVGGGQQGCKRLHAINKLVFGDEEARKGGSCQDENRNNRLQCEIDPA